MGSRPWKGDEHPAYDPVEYGTLYLLLKEFPLEFCNGGSSRKGRVMPVPDGGKSLTIYPFI